MEPTAPPVAETPDLSLPQRIWGALVSPRIVFESLRARPRILGAMLVLCALYVAVGFVLSDLSAEAQIEALNDREGLTEDDRLQAENRIRSFTKIIGPVGGAAGAVIGVYLVGGILLFIGNVLLGGDGRFKQYAAAAAHVQMVAIPAILVRVPLALATGELEGQTSLAALLPADAKGSLLYNALGQLDVFGLWQVALAALAVAVMARVDTKKAAIAVVGAWLVWTVVWVPLQTFLGGLGG